MYPSCFKRVEQALHIAVSRAPALLNVSMKWSEFAYSTLSSLRSFRKLWGTQELTDGGLPHAHMRRNRILGVALRMKEVYLLVGAPVVLRDLLLPCQKRARQGRMETE